MPTSIVSCMILTLGDEIIGVNKFDVESILSIRKRGWSQGLAIGGSGFIPKSNS